MHIHLNPADSLQVTLSQNQVLTAPQRDGLTIETLEGAVWITFASEGRDHVLQPGERLELGRAGKAVVQAMQASRVALSAPARQEGVVGTAVRRLSACFADLPVCTRNRVHTQSSHRLSLETL
ncbi:MAG: DUF2917 domain-containing protein [Betaproteobacteria bacterium]|nr:DUF2917 domain-containing protein [Betaproteobacteria bacterium]